MDVQTWLQRYAEAKTLRSPFESDWRQVALMCLPRQYGLWNDGPPLPGTDASGPQTARRRNFDSTALLAVPKYSAILDKMLTPSTQPWTKLAPDNPYLRKIRRVQLYYDEVTDILWKERYAPRARFIIAQSELYSSHGVYGNAVKFVSARKPSFQDPRGGLLYRSVPFAKCYVMLDENENPHGVFRAEYLNARQVRDKFPDDPLPDAIRAELEKPRPDEGRLFEIIHIVCTNAGYDAGSLGSERYPFMSAYICVEGKQQIGETSGYYSFPYMLPRAHSIGGGFYGYGPAQIALGAIGGVSAMKKTLLRTAQKAADPVLLAHDDGVLSGGMDLRPGRINTGTVDAQGRKLVHALETGRFDVAHELLQDERNDIKDAFGVNLFQILMDNPQQTATEVLEKIGERAALLAPMMGRMQSEDLGPMIEREIDLLARQGRLPDMPPELVEAEGEYSVIYTSPLAKAQRTEAASGFMRTVGFAAEAAQATGNPGLLDPFNFDEAIPEIAEAQGVPARWMNDLEKIQAIQEGRAQAAQDQQMIDALPGVAGGLKAAAAIGKGGSMPK